MTPPVPSESTRLAEALAAETAARQRLETALAELERRHSSILNSVNEIVFQTDLDGRWTFLNSAWSDFLEHSARQNLGRPMTEHLHPDEQPRVRELIEALATGRTELIRAEIRFLTGSGQERWFELLARPTVESDGAGSGITGTLSDISIRKRAEAELSRLHQAMLETSRQAGMAEVATNVLHNVGNALNSVNVSATLVIESLHKSKVTSLASAVELLTEHQGDLGGFLAGDPRGQRMPGFLAKLSNQLTHDRAVLIMEMEALKNNIDHIKQIVAMQQSYARVSGAVEPLAASELAEDALCVLSAALAQQQVEVVREFLPVPAVLGDRHKVLQILVNLITNATDALGARNEGRCLNLRITSAPDGRVRLEVKDNGPGIAPENLTRIFNHGFTTKKSGRGFGLHAAANAAKEMKGSLSVHSAGPGHGATFILELPAAGGQSTGKEVGHAA